LYTLLPVYLCPCLARVKRSVNRIKITLQLNRIRDTPLRVCFCLVYLLRLFLHVIILIGYTGNQITSLIFLVQFDSAHSRMKKYKKRILINHLYYCIDIFDVKDCPKEHKEKLHNMKACALAYDDNNGQIYIKYPIQKNTYSTIAHEITHILQEIARVRNIDFTSETEHFGYMMQYIFNEILGYEYS